MKVYLIRHARTEDAEKGIHQRNGTRIIADSIDPKKFSDLKPDKVYSSPLTRARQSAKLIFGDYEILDYIYEFVAPKILYGKERSFGKKFWEKHLHEVRENNDWTHDGSESFNEIKARVKRLLDFLKSQPYKKVAVIAHRTFFQHFLGVIKFGDKYTFKDYEKTVGKIKWDNLEVKEIEL